MSTFKDRFIDTLQPLFLVMFAVLGLALANALVAPVAQHERTGTVEIHAVASDAT
jgi:F0F1-type ATP synthase assembly protein I